MQVRKINPFKQLLCFGLLTLVSLKCQLSNHNDDGRLKESEYEIYNTVIAKVITDYSEYISESRNLILVVDSTFVWLDRFHHHTLDDQINSVKPNFPNTSPETFNSFRIRNEKNSLLNGHKIKLPIKHRLVSKNKIQTLRNDFKHDFWNILPQKYKGLFCMVRLSRIGFNEMRNQAILYFEYMFDGLSGAGNFVYLTKKGKGWSIANWVKIWYS